MKKNILPAFTLIALLCLMIISSCGPKSTVTPKSSTEQQFEKLNGAWKLSSVSRDGTSEIGNGQGSVLTISNTGPLGKTAYDDDPTGAFPIGPFTLKSETDVNTLVFAGQKDLEVSVSVGGNLTFTFTTDIDGNKGRGLKGEWIYVFTK